MEYTYSKNEFGRDTMYSGDTEKVLQIIRLIYLEPGQNPSIPDAGIGIKKYRFQQIDDSDDLIDEMLEEINSQREIYLPHTLDVDIDATYDELNRSIVFTFSKNGTPIAQYDDSAGSFRDIESVDLSSINNNNK